jgi:hypothetical protein
MSEIGSQLKNGIFACLAICAADGLISGEEEKCLEKEFEKYFGIASKDFQKIIDLYFRSQDQLEIFLLSVDDVSLRTKIIEIARLAAAADGLQINENIALQKAEAFWGEAFV